MTEEEWLTCTDPMPVLEWLQGNASNRKFLLFAAACWRRRWLMLADERSRNGVRGLEAVAEGERVESESLHLAEDGDFIIICGGKYNAGIKLRPRDAKDTAIGSLEMVADAEAAEQMSEGNGPQFRGSFFPLLEDIFGSPFRPVTINQAWLTSDVVALADGIYADRAFDRMPILADSLQDAGCDNEDILSHCRNEHEHVRGCWAIDLVLGKA